MGAQEKQVLVAGRTRAACGLGKQPALQRFNHFISVVVTAVVVVIVFTFKIIIIIIPLYYYCC